jgi:hypothetical protein
MKLSPLSAGGLAKSAVSCSNPGTKRPFTLPATRPGNRHVEETLLNHSPDVVVLNSGDARIPGLARSSMNKEDVYEVFKAAPRATLIASHMEA